MKRSFDVAFAVLGLVIASPFIALGAVLVKLDSPGPAFYRSPRVGLRGAPFQMYKLRSMSARADQQGPAVTGAHDPRVTRAGRLLRRTKIDEIPQLLNVLRGEMSVVGPRPEAPEFVALYTPEQRRVLEVRPGMTGPAALAYMNEEEMLGPGDPRAAYINKFMPAKLALDLEYVRTASFAGDLGILARTVWVVVSGRRPARTSAG